MPNKEKQKKLQDMENNGGRTGGDGSNPFSKTGDKNQHKKPNSKPKMKPKEAENLDPVELLATFRAKTWKIHSIIDTTLQQSGQPSQAKIKGLVRSIKQVHGHVQDLDKLMVKSIARKSSMSDSEQLSLYIMKDDLARIQHECQAFKSLINAWIMACKLSNDMQTANSMPKKPKTEQMLPAQPAVEATTQCLKTLTISTGKN